MITLNYDTPLPTIPTGGNPAGRPDSPLTEYPGE